MSLWLVYSISHANGASFFFIVVYMHLFRGLYYGSYLYPTYVMVLRCHHFIADDHYIFSRICFTMGTNVLLGSYRYYQFSLHCPLFGQEIVNWLWSGFSVDNSTISKFFSLHYILPFVILAFVLLHLALLHQAGSSTSYGWRRYIDEIPFHPYYTIKDFYSVILFIAIIIFFVSFMPNILGHPDNYIPANPDQTPEHIVPEWYFLPFYAILRSIPNKLL